MAQTKAINDAMSLLASFDEVLATFKGRQVKDFFMTAVLPILNNIKDRDISEHFQTLVMLKLENVQ